MSRFFSAFFAFFFCCLAVFAQTVSEGVSSRYADGRYCTSVSYVVNVPFYKLGKVIDEMFKGAQKDPTKSLSWLWKNLGQHDNVEGDIALSEHGVVYDPKTFRFAVKLGVAANREKEPDVFDVEGEMFCQTSSADKKLVLSVTKKFKMLNNADFIFTVKPLPKGKSLVMVDSGICFSRFITLLLTENKYRSLVEWRVQGLAKNIKKRAEGDTSPNY